MVAELNVFGDSVRGWSWQITGCGADLVPEKGETFPAEPEARDNAFTVWRVLTGSRIPLREGKLMHLGAGAVDAPGAEA